MSLPVLLERLELATQMALSDSFLHFGNALSEEDEDGGISSDEEEETGPDAALSHQNNGGAGYTRLLSATLRSVNVNRAEPARAHQLNPDEDIIRKRGRRQLPATPVRKSPRKRNISSAESTDSSSPPLLPYMTSSSSTTFANSSDVHSGGQKEPSVEASPFTKVLRGLQSPVRPENARILSLRKRICQSPDSAAAEEFFNPSSSAANKSSKSAKLQAYYYSPISRKLRSSDSSGSFDDSGVDLVCSPLANSHRMSTNSTTSSTDIVDNSDNISLKSCASAKSSASSKTSTSTTINKARRRLRL